MLIPGQSFWQFSQGLYQAAGVEECCIALQEDHGADVNILLLCCWCGARGCGLDGAWFRALLSDPQLLVWREQCIAPLRCLRRLLKTQGMAGAQQLREGVKRLELEAEKLEQDFLLQQLPGGADDVGGIELLWGNLRAYWLVLLEQEPTVVSFTPLLRATFPGSSDKELLGVAAV
jgi:uncharacterized protein (TIGR02444 family)